MTSQPCWPRFSDMGMPLHRAISTRRTLSTSGFRKRPSSCRCNLMAENRRCMCIQHATILPARMLSQSISYKLRTAHRHSSIDLPHLALSANWGSFAKKACDDLATPVILYEPPTHNPSPSYRACFLHSRGGGERLLCGEKTEKGQERTLARRCFLFVAWFGDFFRPRAPHGIYASMLLWTRLDRGRKIGGCSNRPVLLETARELCDPQSFSSW